MVRAGVPANDGKTRVQQEGAERASELIQSGRLDRPPRELGSRVPWRGPAPGTNVCVRVRS